ncbi:MAG: hypothetical protein RL069_1607, partial [Planctomycetota bacterium]
FVRCIRFDHVAIPDLDAARCLDAARSSSIRSGLNAISYRRTTENLGHVSVELPPGQN